MANFMDNKTIYEKLKQKFQDAIVAFKEPATGSHGDPFIEVPAEKIHSILKFLKEEPELHFDNLLCISGVDYPDRLEVVYHFHSYTHLHKIVLKTLLTDNTKPEIDTVSDLWKGANWLEREIYDLFGITFKNHPDLRRILLPDDWEGYPLRKDYKHQDYWHGIKVGM